MKKSAKNEKKVLKKPRSIDDEKTNAYHENVMV